MPPLAFALALAAAFLHALWNLLLARERDPEPATAVAICASVVVFAPVAVLVWDVDTAVWPYLVATSALQFAYFALLASAYRYAELSFVYPIARGLAPVLVLLIGVVVLGTSASTAQAVGVTAVGLGVLLVRGLGGERDLVGGALALAIAGTIAGYTLVDKSGIRYANPLVYLEVGMAPVAVGGLLLVLALPAGRTRVRAALRPTPAFAGVVSFLAYVLVLAALSRAPAASVAAVRETSVLIVAVLVAPMLGERVGLGRLAGAALVVCGVGLIVLLASPALVSGHARQMLLAPPLSALEVVEREHVKAGNVRLPPVDARAEPQDERVGVEVAVARAVGLGAGAQRAQRVADADPLAHAHELRSRDRPRKADVDRQPDASLPDRIHPRGRHGRVEADLGDDVRRELCLGEERPRREVAREERVALGVSRHSYVLEGASELGERLEQR